MRLYLDTEFNGFGGKLISMALVSGKPLAHEWYGWIAPGDLGEPIEPWVKDNVIPKLRHGNASCFSSLAAMKLSFHHFIMKFTNPEIICDWHADASHFCDMLADVDYASSLDFACVIRIIKTPPGEPKPELPHNALSDAKALRDWHQDYSEGR